MTGEERAVERRPLLQVALHPYTSAWLATKLKDAFWGPEIAAQRARGYDRIADVLEADRDRLVEAARQWAEHHIPATSFARETAKHPAPQVGAASVADEISTDEAAQMLQCSAQWVRRLLQREQLLGRQVGSVWFVDRESVRSYVQAKEAS